MKALNLFGALFGAFLALAACDSKIDPRFRNAPDSKADGLEEHHVNPKVNVGKSESRGEIDAKTDKMRPPVNQGAADQSSGNGSP